MTKLTMEINFTDAEINAYNFTQGYVESENGNALEFFSDRLKLLITDNVLQATKKIIAELKQEEIKAAYETIEANAINKVLIVSNN